MPRRGFGEGSISKKPNGKYIAQVTIGSKRLSKVFPTKDACKEWIAVTKKQIGEGMTYDATRMTVADYMDHWLKSYLPTVRPSTAVNYTRYVTQRIVPALGKFKLKDLTPVMITGFYANLEDQKVGSRTRRFVHQVLRLALNTAVKEGFLTRNPVNGALVPRYVQKEMKILDTGQIMQFLQAAQGNRLEILFLLALKTGMREGELLGLRWDCIDWDRNTIRITEQLADKDGKPIFAPVKTAAGKRTIKLDGDTMKALATQKERLMVDKALKRNLWKDYNLVFPSTVGTPLGKSNMIDNFHATLDKAGIPRIRFHDLRHTAASIMLANNVPVILVSKFLGHSKPSITSDIYGHLLSNSQDEIVRAMESIGLPIQIEIKQPS